MSGLEPSWKMSNSSSLQITPEETEPWASSAAPTATRTCPRGMLSGHHLPAYGPAWPPMPASLSHGPWGPPCHLHSQGPPCCSPSVPALGPQCGEVRGWRGPGARPPPCSSSLWGEGCGRFSHIPFQPFLGILNFALQSEGSKEWLPWQPFPCFCHQGTQHSV